MTLSTNSFDEFHCQAADNFDSKEENESSKYFYHKILSIWEFPRSLWRECVCIHIRDQKDHHHVSTNLCRPASLGISCSTSPLSLPPDRPNLLPQPESPGGPLVWILNLPNFSSAACCCTWLGCGQLYAVARCTDRRQASSVARPDAGGAQLQTRVRRAGVKSSVTELRPHPRDKTRQKQGYQEASRQ